MEIIHIPDAEKLYIKAAMDLINSIREILNTKPFCVMAVSGGRSVDGIFRLLEKDNSLPWRHVHLFMADERAVPIDHKDSNYRQAHESFIGPLTKRGLLPESHVHPFEMKGNLEQSVVNYNTQFLSFGGKYDIALMGTGEDGHIAGLFPNHPGIEDDSPAYIAIHDSPKPPPDRMTASKNLIASTRYAYTVFLGRQKTAAYRLFLNPVVPYTECPSKLVAGCLYSVVYSDID
ncbi:MAG: 6-phosphogluconolactonase [Spirochaetales bacterium]|nr:6-phosphogluconolactonase [Spirochaetales bacterium]